MSPFKVSYPELLSSCKLIEFAILPFDSIPTSAGHNIRGHVYTGTRGHKRRTKAHLNGNDPTISRRNSILPIRTFVKHVRPSSNTAEEQEHSPISSVEARSVFSEMIFCHVWDTYFRFLVAQTTFFYFCLSILEKVPTAFFFWKPWIITNLFLRSLCATLLIVDLVRIYCRHCQRLQALDRRL